LEISINKISDDTIVNYLIEECGADIKKKKKKKKKKKIKVVIAYSPQTSIINIRYLIKIC